MMIPVIYPDGTHDQVKDFMLSRLIDEKGIIEFKRSSGWVRITSYNIRSAKKSFYTGPERRQQNSVSPELPDIF